MHKEGANISGGRAKLFRPLSEVEVEKSDSNSASSLESLDRS